MDGKEEGVDLIAEWKIVDARTEDLTIGQQYKYFFKTDEIKKPIQEAVIACGWVYKGVVFGKL